MVTAGNTKSLGKTLRTECLTFAIDSHLLRKEIFSYVVDHVLVHPAAKHRCRVLAMCIRESLSFRVSSVASKALKKTKERLKPPFN